MAKKTIREFIIRVDDKGTITGTAKKMDVLNKSMDKTSHTANKLKRNQEGVGKQSLNNSKGFARESQGLGGLVRVYATVAANVFALSSAYLVLKRNSNLQIMIEASKDLSNTTGKNYASVARGLQNIAAGALNMNEAMQAANLGLSGGATKEQLAGIATIATKAAQVLGRSVPEAITRMTQAVIKGEPELVDEFGIILRVTAATEKYAEAHGLAVKDLTAFQKSQAITLQLLEQGEQKFSSAQIRENPYEQLSASLVDVGDKMLALFSGPLGGLVSFIATNSGLIIALITGIASKIANLALPALNNFGNTAAESSRKAAEEFKKNIAAMRTEVERLNAELNKPAVTRQKDIIGDKVRKALIIDQEKLNKRSNIGKSSGLSGADFLDKNAASLRSKLTQKAIDEAKRLNQKYIQLQGGLKVLTVEGQRTFDLLGQSTTKAGQAALQTEASVKKVSNTIVNSMNKATIATNNWKIKVLEAKAVFSTGFANVQSSPLFSGAISKEASNVAQSINKGNGFLSSMAKGASFAAFSIAKVGTNAISALTSFSAWGFALIAAFQILKTIGTATGFISENYRNVITIIEETEVSLKEQEDITKNIVKHNLEVADGLEKQVAKNKANNAALLGNISATTKVLENIENAVIASDTLYSNFTSLFGVLDTPLEDVLEQIKKGVDLSVILTPDKVKSSRAFEDALQAVENSIVSVDMFSHSDSPKAVESRINLAKNVQVLNRLSKEGAQEVSDIYSETADAVKALNSQAAKFSTQILNSSVSSKNLTNVEKILRQEKLALDNEVKRADLIKGFDSPIKKIIGITKDDSLDEAFKKVTEYKKVLDTIVKKEITNATNQKTIQAEIARQKSLISKGDIDAIGVLFDKETQLNAEKILSLNAQIELQKKRVNSAVGSSSVIQAGLAAEQKLLEIQRETLVDINIERTEGLKSAMQGLALAKAKVAIEKEELAGLKNKVALFNKIAKSASLTKAQNFAGSVSSFATLKQQQSSEVNLADAEANKAQKSLNVALNTTGTSKDVIKQLEIALNNSRLAIDQARESHKIANRDLEEALLKEKTGITNVFDKDAFATGVARFRQTTREAQKKTTSDIELYITAINASIDKFSDSFVDNLMDGELSIKDAFKGIGKQVWETFRETMATGLKQQMSSAFKGIFADFLPKTEMLLQTNAVTGNTQALWALNSTMGGVGAGSALGGAGGSILGGISSGIGSFFNGSSTSAGDLSSITEASYWASQGVGDASTGFLSGIGDFFSGFSFFAKGGITNGASIAGEEGPEAVVPLPDGRSIPVHMNNNSSGSDTFNISVTVNESGQATTSGAPGKGEELAKLMTVAIQDELTKQKRPGGILYSNQQGNRR